MIVVVAKQKAAPHAVLEQKAIFSPRSTDIHAHVLYNSYFGCC